MLRARTVRHQTALAYLFGALIAPLACSAASVPRLDVPTNANDGTWSTVAPPAPIPFVPAGRVEYGAIYDAPRDRYLMFGGLLAGGALSSELWAFSHVPTEGCVQIIPAGTPPAPRRGASCIYDPVRDAFIVFGGLTASGAVNDVWSLSLGGTPTWTQLAPLGTPPTSRYLCSSIYDPVGDRLIVYGGIAGTTSSETWQLTLSSPPTWTQLAPTNVPGARSGSTAVYDSARGRMVIMGGLVNGVTYASDMRALVLADPLAWTVITPTGTTPTARTECSMAYDAANDQLQMYGGIRAGGIVLSDEWVIPLASPVWTPANSSNALGDTYGQVEVYDPTRQELVVAVGALSLGSVAWRTSVLLRDPTAWTIITNQSQLKERTSSTAAYDPVRDRMLVYGGSRLDQGSLLTDVWALSLGTHVWSQLTPAGPALAASDGSRWVYDGAADRLLLFRPADLGTVWQLALSGATPTWSTLTTTGAPPNRAYFALALDAPRSRVILQGGDASGRICSTGLPCGTALSDTWSLDLATLTWSQWPVSLQHSSHTMVYDSLNDRMLIFGGIVYAVNVFDWATWSLSLSSTPTLTQLLPSGTLPDRRAGHNAVVDAARNRMVIFGGFNSQGYVLNDVWSLPLTGGPLAWTHMAPDGAASPIDLGAAIYDPVRSQLSVFAGTSTNFPLTLTNNTYQLTWPAATAVRDPGTDPADHLALRGAWTASGWHIAYTLPRPGRTELRAYDARGRLVAFWPRGVEAAGEHVIDGGAPAPARGLYLVELRSGGARTVRPVPLMR